VPQCWTYTLGDFLMFSPATYGRLVDNYHREIWPAQMAGLLAGVVACGLSASQQARAARAQALLLAAAFFWVGWAFFWQRYATINWAARYFAYAFWAQALFMVVLALLPTQDSIHENSTARKTGWFLALTGLLIYPLGSAWSAKTWSRMEVFGVSPEPTALVCLGLLLAHARPPPPLLRWALTLIPAASLLVGAATLSALARG